MAKHASSIELLRQTALFGALESADLDVMAQCLTRRAVARDVVLFEKDAPGDALYIVEYGRVQVYLLNEAGQRVTLKIYGAGEVFGEYSLLDHAPRSAGAAALEHTELLVLHQRDFDAFLDEHPAAGLALLRGLAQRIRYSSSYLQRVTDMIETMDAAPTASAPEHGRNTVGEMTLNVEEFQKLLATMRKK
jgi:CRP/FNR family transcriptional regulator, cyclic AMP receptor protein